MWGADRGWGCVDSRGYIRNSCPCLQFCCKPKIFLKKKILLLNSFEVSISFQIPSSMLSLVDSFHLCYLTYTPTVFTAIWRVRTIFYFFQQCGSPYSAQECQLNTAMTPAYTTRLTLGPGLCSLPGASSSSFLIRGLRQEGNRGQPYLSHLDPVFHIKVPVPKAGFWGCAGEPSWKAWCLATHSSSSPKDAPLTLSFHRGNSIQAPLPQRIGQEKNERQAGRFYVACSGRISWTKRRSSKLSSLHQNKQKQHLGQGSMPLWLSRAESKIVLKRRGPRWC